MRRRDRPSPLLALAAPVFAQDVDRSSPPIAEASTGGFTVRRLADPVAVDDRDWLSVQPIWPGDRAVAGDGEYTVSLEQTSDEGDVQRARPIGGWASIAVFPLGLRVRLPDNRKRIL